MIDYSSFLQDYDEDAKTSMKEWILKTFKMRECVKFLNSNNLKNKCGCGRIASEHKRINRVNSKDGNDLRTINEDPNLIWKIQDNTELFPTNAFGTLEFQGADIHTTKAEYIRLSFDTKPQNIIKLLKDYWQLELPKLIISCHGGIANFGLQPKLKKALQEGLIKVANTSHIWIITAGTDTGIVKHVGDILKEYFPKSKHNLIAIGIAPWGVVSEKDSLIGCGIEVPYYTNQRTINAGNMFNLNSCHSYFLLVDDGTVGRYGCEISFRRRVERFLSRHKSEIYMDFDLKPKMIDCFIEEKITLQNYHTIPLVSLIVEGGTNTIQTVLVNVHDKPPVPVVICDGSGRAADLLAFTHKYAYISPVTKRVTMDTDVQEQLISTIMKTFAYTKEQADYLFIQLMNCVINKDLISIYRFGDEDNNEIDLAILTASLKVIDLNLKKQLDIIMSWNRPDVAKQYILLQGAEFEKEILEEKMFEALSQDKVDFVKLLLEYGVNLRKFLTFKRLQDLYNCKKGPPNTLILIIKDVLNKIDSQHKISLPDIGLVVEKLVGSGYVSEYSKKEFKARHNKYAFKRNGLNSTGNNANNNNEDDFIFKYPYNELLIWAILMKRHKMALFVCKRGEETLAKALFSTKLNKALAREAELDDLDSEIADDFKKYADEFSNLAYGLLEKCYKEDDELTHQLLTYDLVNWSHWTCLSLAVCSNLKEFLSHAACQMLINDLWMGGMKIRKHIIFKVITGLLFPPAIFAIQFKSAKELQYMPQTQEEHENELENKDDDDSTSSKENDKSERISLNSLGKNRRTNQDDSNGKEIKTISNIKLDIPIHQQDNNTGLSETEFIANKSKMLSLEQIIELYDEQLTNNTSTQINSSSKKLTDNIVGLQKQASREKKTLNFLVKNRANKIDIGKKLYEFYNAPVTKFWQNTIFYMLFLISFAYIVLVKTPKKPSLVEVFVLVYIFSYGLDKLRELLQTDSTRFSGKIKIFFSNVMNTLDAVFILSIVVALCFRLSCFDEHLKIARLLYCINTIYWYVKLMEILIINKYTGPLIIIASRMLVDLLNFVIILLIVLMCFGLSRQAIKFPNEDFKWSLVKNIFLEPYFMLYGEVYAPDIDPLCDPTTDPDAPQCQYGHWITPLTMTVFMIVACLLFLSILIASFNNTFARIYRQSSLFWKFKRYHFVTTYESKPLWAPPFVVLSHIVMVIKYLVRCCQRKTIKYDRKLKSFLSEEMIQRLHDFEENCFYKYSYDLDILTKERMEEKINNASLKIDSINSRIDDIFFKENITKASLYKVELRLQNLEEISYETIRLLKNLNSKLGNDAATNEQSECRTSMKQKVLRQRSITISGDVLKDSFRSSLLNKSSQNGIAIRPNKSETEKELEAPDSNENFEMKYLNTWNLSYGSSLNEKINEPLENELPDEIISEEVLSQHHIIQQSSGLDQYTLHPFVYLHSVVKPPLAEYTSITDCIDTSLLDRPPSPQLSQNQLGSLTSKFLPAVPKFSNIKDYCAVETTRSAVARQESEILRLAEESQHVIINQMLNKLVKQTSVDIGSDSNNLSTENIVETDDLTDILQNRDTVITEAETTFNKPFKRNKDSIKEHTNLGIKPMINLSGMERNFSQMFYAQTQASALISNVEEEQDETDSGEDKKKLEINVYKK